MKSASNNTNASSNNTNANGGTVSMNVIHKNHDDSKDDEEPVFDLDLDETDVLKRYYTVYTSIKRNKLTVLKSAYNLSNLQSSIVDFSVCFALQGSKYIDEIQMNMQYTVLQAALILTITIPLYVSPPDLSSETYARFFSFFIGFSACLHLYTIIGITILSALFNRPYTESDTILVRIENNLQYVLITVCNYISVIACIIAVLIAGYDRSYFDGGIQSYVVVLVLVLFYSYIKSSKHGDSYQDHRVYAFYKKYCMHDGSLKQEYIAIINQGKGSD